jgi:RNA polymerase sigma factor (sigma-70 family)
MTAYAGLRLIASESDQRLVELACRGDANAFAGIITRYRSPLQRYCGGLVPSSAVDDVVQQAFVNAWGAFSRGAEVRELKPWLYRIARNTAFKSLREARPTDELPETLCGADSPHADLERRMATREALTAVAGLPARQREALVCSAIAGNSLNEVAHGMGVSVLAARQLVHRARVAVRAAAAALIPLPYRLAFWRAGRAGGAERSRELVGGAGSVAAAGGLAKASAVVATAAALAAAPLAVHTGHGPTAARAPSAVAPAPAGSAPGAGQQAGSTSPFGWLAAPALALVPITARNPAPRPSSPQDAGEPVSAASVDPTAGGSADATSVPQDVSGDPPADQAAPESSAGDPSATGALADASALTPPDPGAPTPPDPGASADPPPAANTPSTPDPVPVPVDAGPPSGADPASPPPSP